MKAEEVKSDWTPVLDGDVYCSPRCGFRCKSGAHGQAVVESSALANRLGPGWAARVWENCGWNYSVERGVVVIHVSRDQGGIREGWKIRGYICFINTHPQFVSKNHPTPEAAFADALGQMQTAFDSLTASVGDVNRTAEALKMMDAPKPLLRRPYIECDACKGQGTGSGDNGACEECNGFGVVRELP